MKEKIRLIQARLGVEADGVIGPRTVDALMSALDIEARPVWPTQAMVRSGSSCFGCAGCETDLVSLVPPYPLKYEGKAVRSIRVHKLIAPHVETALREVLEHYGQEEITRLGLDVYGGSYNYRPTATGKALSMHAWGIALDFAPQTNALRMSAPAATLSRPECTVWWQIWERHGAVSLGRERDYDWMHIQFARL